MAAKIKRERLIKMYGSRCFYSNIELDCSNLWNDDGFTIEHLVSVAIYRNKRQEIPGNLVPAARLINCVIGNAPLKVKFAIREHLTKIYVVTKNTQEAAKIYAAATLGFLEQYKIDGLYPWGWQQNFCRNREVLFEAYIELLTDEEITLLFNNKRIDTSEMKKAA